MMPTATEMAIARSTFVRFGISSLQQVQQFLTGLRDIPGAEREHQVSPLGDVAQHARYIVLLGDVVDVGVVARLTDGVNDQLPVYAWLGHLARAVDLGDENRVGGGEGLAEPPVEFARAGVAVRLGNPHGTAPLG